MKPDSNLLKKGRTQGIEEQMIERFICILVYVRNGTIVHERSFPELKEMGRIWLSRRIAGMMTTMRAAKTATMATRPSPLNWMVENMYAGNAIRKTSVRMSITALAR